MQMQEAENTGGIGKRLLRGLRTLPLIKGLRSRTLDELAFIRQVCRQGLWQELSRPRSRPQMRRLQQPLRFENSLASSENAEALAAQLRLKGLEICEGRHALYIPAQAGLAEKLGPFVSNYPADAGFKILKDFHISGKDGTGDESDAAVAPERTRAVDLVFAGNYLHDSGIGPRIYDFAELTAGVQRWPMLVVQHIKGTIPSAAEQREVFGRLRSRMEQRTITALRPDWEGGENLVRCQATGRTYYVGNQTFAFSDYEAHLKGKIEEAIRVAHYGRRYLLRGRYLYQQVPGVAETGKRATRDRWMRITRLLAENDFEVKGRLIFDIGCNTGMMLAEALNDGAQWGLGWDKPQVVEQARPLLWTLGYTRFDMTGAVLTKSTPVAAQVPNHLSRLLNRSIVFYLAIRHHLGFIDALEQIPWEAVVYEGSPEENGEALETVIREFQGRVACKVVRGGRIEDGDTPSRPLLLFVRPPESVSI